MKLLIMALGFSRFSEIDIYLLVRITSLGKVATTALLRITALIMPTIMMHYLIQV
ncbi:MAG: hypothetical protein J5730_04090 [Bacteroidales bacterium]|nr:hypothetical protein [Bacteroidales bacterium]